MRTPVPRRCKERSDVGGQCEYSAGHTGRHSFASFYVYSTRRRNAMLCRMPGQTRHVDVWPGVRGWCKLYAQGVISAEQLKSYLWVRTALEQCPNARRKMNNAIRYYRRYARNGMVR